jgi:hypothetical protein
MIVSNNAMLLLLLLQSQLQHIATQRYIPYTCTFTYTRVRHSFEHHDCYSAYVVVQSAFSLTHYDCTAL